MTDKNISINSIMQDCVTAIICPRGKYYPNKNYGSHIFECNGSTPCQELLAYARQAVSDISGVYVKGVSVDKDAAVFTLLINNEQRQVSINL